MIQSLPTLTKIINRLIPKDDYPNAEDNGVLNYLQTFFERGNESVRQLIDIGCQLMEQESQAILRQTVSQLNDQELIELIAVVQEGQVQTNWTVSPQKFIEQLIALTAEGYYSDPGNGGNPNKSSWRMMGFVRRATGFEKLNFDTETIIEKHIIAWEDVEAEYETIIVGAGAGGGVVAGLLSEAGQKVLIIERGDWLPTSQLSRDHLRNHRISKHGHNTGPTLNGNPREVLDGDLVPPHHWAYHNNAMTVGGGARVFGAQAWRFHPKDFRMASEYGVPENSSLADWPISYKELAPFYEEAEWNIGVSGSDKGFQTHGERKKGYPMPPVPPNPTSRLLEEGAKELGWDTTPIPLLINTKPYQNRSACVQCGECVGFACPSNSKNGSHNTMLPRALASGNGSLLTQSQVVLLETGDKGQVVAVRVRTIQEGQLKEKFIRAKRFVLSAGAIETARLLLNSRSRHHPNGIGNHSDCVGRNLQGHIYSSAYGLMFETVHDGKGPGVAIATCDFNHGNSDIIGGGMLANEFVVLPIIFWHKPRPEGMPSWGLIHKKYMREGYGQFAQITGPIQEIPNPSARVTLSKTRDQMGMPVAKLSGTVHPESVRTAEFMRLKAVEWLRASSAKEVWSQSFEHLPLRLSGGQHQAGTCRMGDDPQNSVTDKWGKVYGHDNLFICDGSIHVTNGGFNPVLTIMALAWRNATAIIQTRR